MTDQSPCQTQGPELGLTLSFRAFSRALLVGTELPVHTGCFCTRVYLTHTTRGRARREPPVRTPTSVPVLGSVAADACD